MKRNSKYLLPLLLIFSLFFLVSCISPFFNPIQGAIKGRIMVPSSSAKDITGWVPLPNAVVTLTDSEGNTHTVNTDSNGYYTIFNVAPGTNYILTATGEVEGKIVILKDFIPQVEAGKTYDAGTADCESTALALVVEALLAEGLAPEDIDPEQIQSTDNFPNLVSQVSLVLEQNGDVTSNPIVNNQIEDVIGEILPSETPSPPSPGPIILSSNADLSALSVSAGALDPVFDSAVTSYAVAVANSVDATTVTPTAADGAATITVDGTPVASGATSASISLSVGANPIDIVVTAEDLTTKTYTVIVNRNSPPSDNANLGQLEIKYIGGIVSERSIQDPIYPAFVSTTTFYILHLVGTSSDIEVVATTEDLSASAIVIYNEESHIYVILVTSEDGTTQNSYVIQAYFYDSITPIKDALEDNINLLDDHIVTVVPGTYQEDAQINFPDKAIRLQSIDPEDSTVQENTIIDGENNYRVFYFDTLSNLGSGTNLTGFTIRKGSTLGNYDGGGIYIRDSSPIITYNTISGNTSDDSGGGIYIRDSSATLINNTISGNICNGGGGIYIHNSSPTITDNTISGNICDDDGGGIYIYNGTPDITDNTISGNICDDDGGGIYIHNSSTSLTSSTTITHNTISGNICGDGGGIYIAYGTYGTPDISNNTITENFCTNYGGGIYIANSTPAISNNTISGNTVGVRGGGIYIANSTPAISNNTILGNTSFDDGGGIYIANGTPVIEYTTLSGNTSYDDGGGIYIANGTPAITNNTTISGNTSYDDGGGIYIANGTPAIEYTTISGNTSFDVGGGIYIYNGTPTITNNTISGNTSYFSGGGIYIRYGTPTIGGSDGSDTGNFNTICGNIISPSTPDQIYPNTYPFNYICDSCVGCGP